ncbi:MAG: GC-type dockerin domain-anchored protein [Phycisphaerales bacterium]
MHPIQTTLNRPSARLAALTLGVGLAAGFTPTAAAQDAGLRTHLSDSIISTGDIVDVEVYGYFPATGFALASVDFDLHASGPAWLSASSGVIAGPSVLGGFFEQAHDPASGVLADPANPMLIWRGEFRPSAPGPAFLAMSASANQFLYYPSDLTSSPASVDDPKPGRAWLMVDPIMIEGVGAVAPGKGTGIDVLPGGTLVAEPREDEVLIGLLLPAVQAAREAARRTRTTNEPRTSSSQIQVVREPEPATGGPAPIDTIAMNYTRVDSGLYEVDIDATLGLTGVLKCLIGDDGRLICASVGSPIFFGRVPSCLRFTIEADDVTGGDEIVLSTCDDEPLFVEIPGQFRGMTSEPVTFRLTPRHSPGTTSFEAIIGQSVEMGGLPSGPEGLVAIEFQTPCRADFDGDGELTLFDFLAFQNAFDTGLRSADFNEDGRINLFDFLAFQNAFDAGC